MPRSDALAGAIRHLGGWPGMRERFAVLMAHHGRPVAEPDSANASAAFPVLPFYDWRQEEAVLGRCLLDWFPAITRAAVPSPDPQLVHFFCGLLTLADWVASDRRAFNFEPVLRPDYWQIAQARARDRVPSQAGFPKSHPSRFPCSVPQPRPAAASFVRRMGLSAKPGRKCHPPGKGPASRARGALAASLRAL